MLHRQLNMYCFSKTRHDSNYREFTHKLFQRGRKDLLNLIKRKTQRIPRSNSRPTTITHDNIIEIEVNSASVGPDPDEFQLEHLKSFDSYLHSQIPNFNSK